MNLPFVVTALFFNLNMQSIRRTTATSTTTRIPTAITVGTRNDWPSVGESEIVAIAVVVEANVDVNVIAAVEVINLPVVFVLATVGVIMVEKT